MLAVAARRAAAEGVTNGEPRGCSGDALPVDEATVPRGSVRCG
jgi:hypothetical protein